MVLRARGEEKQPEISLAGGPGVPTAGAERRGCGCTMTTTRIYMTQKGPSLLPRGLKTTETLKFSEHMTSGFAMVLGIRYHS